MCVTLFGMLKGLLRRRPVHLLRGARGRPSEPHLQNTRWDREEEKQGVSSHRGGWLLTARNTRRLAVGFSTCGRSGVPHGVLTNGAPPASLTSQVSQFISKWHVREFKTIPSSCLVARPAVVRSTRVCYPSSHPRRTLKCHSDKQHQPSAGQSLRGGPPQRRPSPGRSGPPQRLCTEVERSRGQ